jgi:uncharacterized protein with PIN domain
MANIPGPQPQVQHCPVCTGQLRNLRRDELPSRGYRRVDGTISEDTHSYLCTDCGERFEINQQR